MRGNHFFPDRPIALLTALSAGRTIHTCDHAILTEQVVKAFSNDPSLKEARIDVETFTGIVQLSGFVTSRYLMGKAVRLANSIQGVKSIWNCIQIR